jgi:hypothetical protein
MNLPLIILCGIVFLALAAKVYNQLSIKSRCKNSTEGKLIGNDDSFMGMGASPGSSHYYAIYYPIYEYLVDGIAYWAQLKKYNRKLTSFAKTVNVLYDPEDPEKCFINNVPGHIVARYNKAEYDKNNGGKNLTLDYKWRP